MKKIRYTRHARNRMRLHKITESDIETVIGEPDFAEASIRGRENLWKQKLDKFLRITCKRDHEEILIISAVQKKKHWSR